MPRAYLKRFRVRFLVLEPVLGVYGGGNLKNAATMGIEPVTYRSLKANTISTTPLRLIDFIPSLSEYRLTLYMFGNDPKTSKYQHIRTNMTKS